MCRPRPKLHAAEVVTALRDTMGELPVLMTLPVETAALCDTARVVVARLDELTHPDSMYSCVLMTPEEQEAAFVQQLERLGKAYEEALREYEAESFEYSTVRAVPHRPQQPHSV